MKEKILDKIKKLLALSSNNSNESEAMAAMAKVQELLTENGLNLEDLPPDELDENEVGEDALFTGSRIAQWKQTLMIALGGVNECEVFRSGENIRMVGRKVRMQITHSMFDYLVNLVEREHKAAKARTLIPQHMSRQWSTAFRDGMATRIAQRLKEQKNEQITRNPGIRTAGLALINENKAYLARNNYRLSKEGVTKKRYSNPHGYAAGKSAGDRAGLHNQVGGASTPRNRMLSGY